MLDHLQIRVVDYDASKAFYLKALAPLGMRVIKDLEGCKACGLGKTFPGFWICQAEVKAGPPQPAHFAFAAGSRAAVRAFHKAALEAGGKDNGPPGFRPQYHANYYGAFVIDPSGYNIEAVTHMPEGLAEWMRFVWSTLLWLLRGRQAASGSGGAAHGKAD